MRGLASDAFLSSCGYKRNCNRNEQKFKFNTHVYFLTKQMDFYSAVRRFAAQLEGFTYQLSPGECGVQFIVIFCETEHYL